MFQSEPLSQRDESTETQLLRDAVQRVTASYGYRYFSEISRTKANPTELWSELGAAGFIGVNIPEEYGGGGRGLTELSVVTEEVAASGCPLMLLALSPAVCASILNRYGSSDQRAEWLPGLASGERIMAFAITEPDAGSNIHNIRTQARRERNAWVISGSKTFVSHVDNAKGLLVVARTDTDESNGRALLSLFIVPTDHPNLDRSLIEVDILSPERQFILHFDNVRLPADALVGEVNSGHRPLFAGLNPERIGSAAVVNGISRYLLNRAAEYARSRQVWDVPIGAHQAVAHPLARAYAYLELARLGTSRAAEMYDLNQDSRGEQANVAKLAASEAAAMTLDAAIQSHGGNGFASEYGIAAMWGLVRLFRVAPVSSEMILNHIAQHSLGLPRSY